MTHLLGRPSTLHTLGFFQWGGCSQWTNYRALLPTYVLVLCNCPRLIMRSTTYCLLSCLITTRCLMLSRLPLPSSPNGKRKMVGIEKWRKKALAWKRIKLHTVNIAVKYFNHRMEIRRKVSLKNRKKSIGGTYSKRKYLWRTKYKAIMKKTMRKKRSNDSST